MKINIGKHEFTECWDGVLYKVLSGFYRNGVPAICSSIERA